MEVRRLKSEVQGPESKVQSPEYTTCRRLIAVWLRRSLSFDGVYLELVEELRMTQKKLVQPCRLLTAVFSLTDARCPMPDARCPMPDARCPMPDARCPMPDARI